MNKEEIIKGILEKLYEEKSFTIPNGGDIPKVEITYEDWVWIEQFLAKEITDLLKAQNQDLLKKIEEMKKDNFKEGTFTYAFQDLRNRAMQEGYNQALKDIKKLINPII